MTRKFALLPLLALAACAPADAPSNSSLLSDPRVQIAEACSGYAGAIRVATAAINADKVSDEGVQRLVVIRNRIGPLCEQQDTTDPAIWLSEIILAGSEISLIVGEH